MVTLDEDVDPTPAELAFWNAGGHPPGNASGAAASTSPTRIRLPGLRSGAAKSAHDVGEQAE